MTRLRFIPKGGAGNTELTRKVLNQVIMSVNKLKGDGDGDGLGDNIIPTNVYPVADGGGGFLAGRVYIEDARFLIDIGSDNMGAIKANPVIGSADGTLALAIGNGNLGLTERFNRVMAVGFNNSITNGDTTEHSGIVLVGASNDAFPTVTGAPGGIVTDGINIVAVGNYNHISKNSCVVLGTPEKTVGGYSIPNPTKETVLRGVVINSHLKTAKDETATLTVDECLAGVIRSTSAAPVSLTLPSAADLITVLNHGEQGTTFELIVDNSAGANSVTIVPSATIAAITSPFTITNPMIVTTAQKVGCFKFYFTSTTAAIVARVW